MKTNIITILLLILTTTTAIAITVTGGSSSYSFTVENCTANPTTNLSCDQSTIFYSCDIVNPAFIDYVDYRINGQDFLTTQNSTKPEQFYLIYQKPNETITNNDPLTFDRQRITDVDNKKVNAFLTININHSCTACQTIITSEPIDYCTINNTQTYQFTSTNQTCQSNYNATLPCNYCDPYLIANTTSCNIQNQQTTTYQDLNYNTCCQITGLVEDCPTNFFPFNQPTNNTCEYYQEDFLCNIDQTPIIDDKININCELPEENACCIINIYQNQNGTRVLLQTSPEYQLKSGFSIFPTNVETRTCFQTQNRLLNAYYTNKEIRPNTEYETEVTCTSATSSYRTIKTINPSYKTIDQPIHRIKWVGDNPVITILWVGIAILAILLTLYLIRRVRRR